MTTITRYLPSHTAGASVYIRIYDSARLVFDFSDNTFKALASCTTPYKFCTEKADGDGTGYSDYVVDIDLSLLNDLPTIDWFSLKFFVNATPADSDVAVSDPLDLTVQGGEFGEKAVIAQAITNVKSTAGLALQVAAWLELEATTFDVAASGGTAFTADAATDVITSTAHGLTNTQAVILVSSTTLPAGLAANTVYYVRDATTDTFKLATSSGGIAIDITDTGTGTHKWRRPTCTVRMREHGTEVYNIATTVGPESLVNDGATPKVLFGKPLFEFEVSTPNFTDDRSYDVECTISIDGNSWTTDAREVVVG